MVVGCLPLTNTAALRDVQESIWSVCKRQVGCLPLTNTAALHDVPESI